MTALTAPEPGEQPRNPEAAARRLLRADAAFCAAAGGVAVVAARAVAADVGLPRAVVRLAGAGTAAWAGALAAMAAGEGWRRPIRAVVAVNGLAAAGLVGHAAARGTARGRIGVLALAGCVAGFAVAEARTLVEAPPGPSS